MVSHCHPTNRWQPGEQCHPQACKREDGSSWNTYIDALFVGLIESLLCSHWNNWAKECWRLSRNPLQMGWVGAAAWGGPLVLLCDGVSSAGLVAGLDLRPLPAAAIHWQMFGSAGLSCPHGWKCKTAIGPLVWWMGLSGAWINTGVKGEKKNSRQVPKRICDGSCIFKISLCQYACKAIYYSLVYHHHFEEVFS